MGLNRTATTSCGDNRLSIEKDLDTPPHHVPGENTHAIVAISSEEATKAVEEEENEDESKYPGMRDVLLIMLGVYLIIFIVALDRTIIVTAIPRITDEFHSLGDVGWYGSAYMLTNAGSMLLFGKIYTFYSPKHVIIVTIGLFEIGSTLCGAAPNSSVFIIGRAIAGLGGAGIFTGLFVIIVNVIPLRKRPMYQGFFGGVFGIASVVGPLMGGAFTDKISWRWCFYINLPIGAVTVILLVFLLEITTPEKASTTFREKVAQLDPLGFLCLFPGLVCLLLALQWGGSTYKWSDGRIIALLVLAVVLILAFIVIQIWKQEEATVPPRIVKQRSVAAALWFSIFNGSSFMAMVYYLPLWFQAIKGTSAVQSGIDTLPLLLSLVVGSIVAGGCVTAIGYYAPFMIIGPSIMVVGGGLITTLLPETESPKWIGYQIIFGLGLGLCMQMAGVVLQTVLVKKDAPVAGALSFFTMQLGGAISVSMSQNILANVLTDKLSGVPELKNIDLSTAGATDLQRVVPEAVLPVVISAYNFALTRVFIGSLVLAAAAIFGGLAVEWKSVKGKGRRGAKAAKNTEKGEDV